MIARELRRMGNTVDKYDIEDAFPDKNKLVQYFGTAFFRWKALRYVRRFGHKYDVIQATHGILPFSKRILNFDGILVSMSHGLPHFYRQYNEKYSRKIRARNPRSFLGRAAESIASQVNNPVWAVERSYDAADIISLCSESEYEYVAESLGYQSKAFLRLNGLSEDRIKRLGEAASSPSSRLSNRKVAFIGHWNHRKGASDWSTIIDEVRSENPEVQFMLLGTGKSKKSVLSDISERHHPKVKVVPSYQYEDLPQLLSEATVGVLPSYVEGMPISVLEMLAARLPVVGYDVPGVRDLLCQAQQSLLASVGCEKEIATKVSDLFQLRSSDYEKVSENCEKIVKNYRWKDIAKRYINEIKIKDRKGR